MPNLVFTAETLSGGGINEQTQYVCLTASKYFVRLEVYPCQHDGLKMGMGYI